ncbi:hypothetical protein QF015_001212 [Paenarthrobacter sp. TE4293]
MRPFLDGRRLLLRDAVDTAAPGNELARVNTDHAAAGVGNGVFKLQAMTLPLTTGWMMAAKEVGASKRLISIMGGLYSVRRLSLNE